MTGVLIVHGCFRHCTCLCVLMMCRQARRCSFSFNGLMVQVFRMIFPLMVMFVFHLVRLSSCKAILTRTDLFIKFRELFIKYLHKDSLPVANRFEEESRFPWIHELRNCIAGYCAVLLRLYRMCRCRQCKTSLPSPFFTSCYTEAVQFVKLPLVLIR